MGHEPKLRFPGFSDSWIQTKAGNYFEQVTGFPIKSDDITENSNGTPILRGVNITEGRVRHSPEVDRFYLGDIAAYAKYIVREGDIVLGMDGSKVGKNVAVVSSSDAGSLLIQRVARLRGNGVGSSDFIYHLIFSYKFHRYVDVVNTSSGIPHISSKQINDYPICVPSKPEQQKIADFLTAVDTKIEQLTRKEELLKQYKKGVMQKIFSQEIRFKADDGSDLRKGSLKDFGYFYYGKGAPKSSVVKDAQTPCVRYGELYGKYDEIIRDILSYTNIQPTNLKFSVGGEVLIPRVGENPLDFANCSFLPIPNVAIGEMISVYNTTENGLFLTYYFNAMLKKQFAKYVEGSTPANLYFRYLENIEIEIPSINEQERIVEFLTTIDLKILGLKKALSSAKCFKKGLLQQMFV